MTWFFYLQKSFPQKVVIAQTQGRLLFFPAIPLSFFSGMQEIF
jgi:hypothetical protein